MPQRNPSFWTDYVQAAERLNNTVILYDKFPFLVVGVEPFGNTGAIVTGHLYQEGVPKTERKVLSDPLFRRFRVLPPLGWINSIEHKRALFLERIPTRSRSHGLNNNNVRINAVQSEGEAYQFEDNRFLNLVADKGYGEACEGIRPPLKDVLSRIRPGSAIAVSEKFAVFRDNCGMRWLYKNLEKVGLFVGADTLMLLESKTFFREEVESSDVITITNIREF